MRLPTTIATALLLTTALGASAQPGTRLVHKPDRAGRAAGELPYLLYLPAGYDADPERRWPLLVFLHGSRGSGFAPETLARYPIPRLIESGKQEVPFVALVPQAPPGRLWPEVGGTMELIDETSARRRVDLERIYLAGQSMGAEGVWYLAYRHPDRFAAIAPMFGPASPFWAERLATTPAWVFHGARDGIIPVTWSDHMVAELRRHGAEVRYSRPEDGQHRPPDEAELLELLGWFLEHRRGQAD